jgi:LacI family transcriptional regulator
MIIFSWRTDRVIVAEMAKKAKKPASIFDVAKKAGVSISTISRAMNDKDRLNPQTYEKVKRAMDELNYRKTGRSAASQRVRTVAVVVPTILDPFFSVVLHGIDANAKTYGYNLLFFDSNNSVEIEAQNVRRILNSPVDGVIFVPSSNSVTGYSMLRDAGLPVVLLDRLLDVEDPSFVISNDEEGAYLATKYLLDLGHRRILYVGGIHTTSTEGARLNGYVRALRECGIPLSEDLVSECQFDSESACIVMTKILQGSRPFFSAVFAGNDLIAFGIRKVLEEIGFKVPEDISLVGYGDMPFARMISLTSVSCPALEMAKSAVSLLIQIIEKKFVSSHRTIMRPALVLRSSCRQIGAVRHPDPERQVETPSPAFSK